MANFLFKLIFFGFIGWVIYMIAIGDMGEAKKATQNYGDVMLKGRSTTQPAQK